MFKIRESDVVEEISCALDSPIVLAAVSFHESPLGVAKGHAVTWLKLLPGFPVWLMRTRKLPRLRSAYSPRKLRSH